MAKTHGYISENANDATARTNRSEQVAGMIVCASHKWQDCGMIELTFQPHLFTYRQPRFASD